MSVDVVIEDDRWAGAGLRRLAGRAVDATLSHAGLDPAAWEVTVLACDDARIAALNDAFRTRPQPTNVLSWPSRERSAEKDGDRPDPPTGDAELGDIAISYDTCRNEAASGGKSLQDHALHLVVHGTLHLLGYDHERDGDADLMESTETAILCKLGVADPYGGQGHSGSGC